MCAPGTSRGFAGLSSKDSRVDMLNLTYHETRDEVVYNVISARMQDKYDIFGGLHDCIDDDWIEDIEEFEERARSHCHRQWLADPH